MRTKKLIEYMRYRAAVEETEWELPEWFVEAQFNAGIRVFFGVKLTDDGGVVEDMQNPEALAGFLERQ